MAEDALEPLITQCPTCRTRFRVTESQLDIAGGRVRCGACLSVFTGIEHLVASGSQLREGESPNEALDALLEELRRDPGPTANRTGASSPPAHDRMSDAPVPRRARAEALAADANKAPVNHPDAAERGVTERVPQSKLDDSPVSTLDAVAARRLRRLALRGSSETTSASTASDAATTKDDSTNNAELERVVPATQLDIRLEDLIERPRRRRRWWLPVAVLAAVVLLGAQVLYFQFDAWAKNPSIRPVYEWLCPMLHCELPVMRAVDEIRSRNLVVRANPEVPGELTVDALIINQARFAQPFPEIELRFSSVDGRPIAARRFKPSDYLAGELKGATMFAPMTPVHIALEIEDPGPEAVSYFIQFR